MDRTYADLEIHILGRQEAGYVVELTLDGQRQFERGFLDHDIKPWVSSDSLETDGERLFNWLFADESLKLAWAKASGVDTECRVRLRIDASVPKLHTLPWELLRQPATTGTAALQLAADSKTPFSRYLALTSAPGQPVIVDRLKILLAVADAEDLPDFDLAAIEREKELAALSQATTDLNMDLQVLDGPCTLAALEEALRQGYHVLHLVAHGAYSDQTGTTLYLADEENQVRLVDADKLANMLGLQHTRESLLRLVFLASCQTATSSSADAFRGLAPQLLRAGLPAVLAMQDLVPIPTAHKFAQSFYDQLLRHGLVDLAANQARASVLTAGLRGAEILVLYMRVPDGKLIELAARERYERVSVSGPDPYQGLEPFQLEQSAYYFGRHGMVDRLVERVSERDLVAVVGPSGSGKSSLVRAGLQRALNEGAIAGSEDWLVRFFRPGKNPLGSLAVPLVDLLEPESSEVDRLAEARKLATHLQEGTVSLEDVAERLREKHTEAPRFLLVADQFEELYTEGAEEGVQQVFLDALVSAAETDRIGVLLTLRADFFDRVLRPPLSVWVDAGLVNVMPMNVEERREAIEQPAHMLGREFEAGLVERILEDVSDEPGDLPLLEFALTELWDRQTALGMMTHQAYDEIGGVTGAIATRAEEVVSRLEEEGASASARRTLTRLVNVASIDEGGRDTPRRGALDMLDEKDRSVVDALVTSRLLVTGRDEVTGEQTVELAHAALIGQWQTLQGWLNEDREFLLWQQRLQARMTEWQEQDEHEDFLLQGKALAEAEETAIQYGDDMTPEERAYLEVSQALRDRQHVEKEQQQKRELEAAQRLAEAERQRAEEQALATSQLRRRQIYLYGAMILAIMAFCAATYFGISEQVRKRDAEEALQGIKRAASAQGNQSERILEAQATLASRLGTALSEPVTASMTEEDVVLTGPFTMQLVRVPAGEFLMGTAREEISSMVKRYGGPEGWYEDEFPQHLVKLPDFYIGKSEVTNVQYAAFVEATGHGVPIDWRNRSAPAGLEDHPVNNVSWEDAVAFSEWLSAETEMAFILPSEAQWEKACRGTEGAIFPWGDSEPDLDKLNHIDTDGDRTEVGSYSPLGDSPYGVVDMAGNVAEWTSSMYEDYPYDESDGRENMEDRDVRRVLRGGWSISHSRSVRCASRHWGDPDGSVAGTFHGFRVGLLPPSTDH